MAPELEISAAPEAETIADRNFFAPYRNFATLPGFALPQGGGEERGA